MRRAGVFGNGHADRRGLGVDGLGPWKRLYTHWHIGLGDRPSLARSHKHKRNRVRMIISIHIILDELSRFEGHCHDSGSDDPLGLVQHTQFLVYRDRFQTVTIQCANTNAPSM